MPGSGLLFAFLHITITFRFCQELFGLPILADLENWNLSRWSVSLSASCARYGSPCFDFPWIISQVRFRVKYYFSVFRKLFLIPHGGRVCFSVPFSSLRYALQFLPPLPVFPLSHWRWGSWPCLSARVFPGWLLSAVPYGLRMRLSRCKPFGRIQKGNGRDGGEIPCALRRFLHDIIACRICQHPISFFWNFDTLSNVSKYLQITPYVPILGNETWKPIPGVVLVSGWGDLPGISTCCYISHIQKIPFKTPLFFTKNRLIFYIYSPIPYGFSWFCHVF